MKDKTSFKKGLFSYGWLVVGTSTLVMVGFYGSELSFGVFLKPILGEFGWTRAPVSGAMSAASAIAGVMGIVTGRLTDKYGARMVIATGAILGILGNVLMSQASSLWHLYVFFGILVGISQSTCWTPLIATASRWFVEKRVLAIGLVTSGLNIGHMILPPLVAHFISNLGWRPAYTVIAFIVFIVALPAIVILGRNPPQATGSQQKDGNIRESTTDKVGAPVQTREWSASEAAVTVPFLMLMVIGFVTGTGFYFLAVHVVAYATDLGIVATSAAWIFTFMSAGNIIGKLLVQPLTTRIGNRYTLFLLLGLQAFALFSLMQVSSLWMFYVLGSIFGFGLGATIPIRMSMVPELFGTKSVGILIGILGIAWAAGGISGPFLAGYIFDLSQSYDIAFLAGTLLIIMGMVATYFLKAPAGSPEAVKSS